MNRIGPSPNCLVCGDPVRDRLIAAETILFRAELARMVVNGMCDDCQLARLKAAIEHENALAEIRLVMELGASWTKRRPPTIHPALAYARWRRDRAEAACVALKMWPADRSAREEKR